MSTDVGVTRWRFGSRNSPASALTRRVPGPAPSTICNYNIIIMRSQVTCQVKKDMSKLQFLANYPCVTAIAIHISRIFKRISDLSSLAWVRAPGRAERLSHRLATQGGGSRSGPKSGPSSEGVSILMHLLLCEYQASKLVSRNNTST
jgi:hypothetical protein